MGEERRDLTVSEVALVVLLRFGFLLFFLPDEGLRDWRNEDVRMGIES
jgi:hypothetical protein